MKDGHLMEPSQALGEGKQNLDGYVIGVDLGGTNLRLGLADASGEVLQRWATSTVGTREPSRIVELIADGAGSMLQEAGLSSKALRGIGIGAPGVTDVDRGVVLQTSYLLGWSDVPIVAMLNERFSVPAAVDNDVNVGLLGEISAGAARGERDVVMVAVGTGVGAALRVGGTMLRGRNWMAGEIGYLLVPGVSDEPVAEDRPGALEEVTGGSGIQTRWSELARQHPELPPALRATEIFDLAKNGEPHAQGILSHVAKTLAAALYNIGLIVDVPLVILGGSVGVHPVLRDAIAKELTARHWRSQPRLVVSELGTEAQVLGAVSLAWQTCMAGRMQL